MKPCSSAREVILASVKGEVNTKSHSANLGDGRLRDLARNIFSRHNLFYDFLFVCLFRIVLSSAGSFFLPQEEGAATVVLVCS